MHLLESSRALTLNKRGNDDRDKGSYTDRINEFQQELQSLPASDRRSEFEIQLEQLRRKKDIYDQQTILCHAVLMDPKSSIR